MITPPDVQLDDDDYDTMADMLLAEIMNTRQPVGVLLFMAMKILVSSHERYCAQTKGNCEGWHELIIKRWNIEFERWARDGKSHP